MLKLRRMLNKKRKGFTLIELIVVLAILAIIALLAVPRFMATLESSKIKTDNANARYLESAAQLYYADKGVYPATLAALAPDYVNAVPALQATANAANEFKLNTTTGAVTIGAK